MGCDADERHNSGKDNAGTYSEWSSRCCLSGGRGEQVLKPCQRDVHFEDRTLDTKLLVERLNELAERLPRITATMILQTIPIDWQEIKYVNGLDDFGVPKDQRALPVTFNPGSSSANPSINFIGLLNGICDSPGDCIHWQMREDGTVRFFQ